MAVEVEGKQTATRRSNLQRRNNVFLARSLARRRTDQPLLIVRKYSARIDAALLLTRYEGNNKFSSPNDKTAKRAGEVYPALQGGGSVAGEPRAAASAADRTNEGSLPGGRQETFDNWRDLFATIENASPLASSGVSPSASLTL